MISPSWAVTFGDISRGTREGASCSDDQGLRGCTLLTFVFRAGSELTDRPPAFRRRSREGRVMQSPRRSHVGNTGIPGEVSSVAAGCQPGCEWLVASGEVEVSNEFSLQHQFGCYLRSKLSSQFKPSQRTIRPGIPTSDNANGRKCWCRFAVAGCFATRTLPFFGRQMCLP